MPDEKIEHNVFISWSGPRSQHVAEALRSWLPMVLQAAKPFMSKKDIDKGSRWHIELARALEITKVGIICLTPENLRASWLLFEAGAVSKTVDRGTRVCTYLLAGLQPQDVPPPLSEFQATKPEKEDTRQLLQNMNVALASPLGEATLNGVFDALWPNLEAQLTALPKPETEVPPTRKVEDMVGELLEIVRAEGNGQDALAAQVSHIEKILSYAPYSAYAALADRGVTIVTPESTNLAWLTPGANANFGAVIARPVGPAAPSPAVKPSEVTEPLPTREQFERSPSRKSNPDK